MSQPYYGQHGQPPNYAGGQFPYYPPPTDPKYNQQKNNHQYPQYPPPSAPPPLFTQSQSMGDNGENNTNTGINDKFNSRSKYRDLCMYIFVMNFCYYYYLFTYF